MENRNDLVLDKIIELHRDVGELSGKLDAVQHDVRKHMMESKDLYKTLSGRLARLEMRGSYEKGLLVAAATALSLVANWIVRALGLHIV